MNIHTCLDIISSKPRKVFDDNKIDFALINVRKHFFEGRSVKVRSAATVITIEFVVCNFMIFAVLLKQNFLSFDRNTSSKVSVINRKSAIKCCLVRRLPMPTFLVLSGTGLHIYYVFQQPIDLYPNIKIQLKSLKYDLTFRLWEYGSTSQVKAIQYQSINQSFRMVGSINDKHGTELVAFRTGERVTLDYLNAYAKPENRVDVNKPFSPSKMTRAEAREAYPEWYERVVVRGEKGRKKWDIAGKVHGDDPYALYHWWLRQIGEIKGGHRYFFLMCLAIYAYKCGVSKQQLRQDMKEAFDDLQMVKHENALTEEDIRSALEAYDKEYYNFTISDIEALTDVRIERNKRNGRSQKEHLKRARAVQEVDYPGGTWRRKGAEEKKAQVYAWRQEHPEGRKADCHRDTGLDPKTIRKWWDTVPEGHITVKIRPSQALSDLLVEEFKKGL